MADSENNSNSIQLMLGYLCVATEPEANVTRKVEILDRFNLTDTQISLICGCNKQSVSDGRQRYKKAKKKK